MRARAKVMSDMIFFYIPKAYEDEFTVGEVVGVIVDGVVIAGKVVKRGDTKWVAVSRKFKNVIKEGEEYEIKKFTSDV